MRVNQIVLLGLAIEALRGQRDAGGRRACFKCSSGCYRVERACAGARIVHETASNDPFREANHLS